MKKLLLALFLLGGMRVESKAQIPPNTVFLYTYVGTALPAKCNNGDAFFNVLIYVRYTCGPINTWTVWAGGSGGTAPVTTNFISGDGAGSFANSGIAVTAAGIVSLFSSCSGTKYLGADGACHTGSGGATIAVTTSTIKGDGAGNGIAVTGTGSNCVHVDGSSAACGTGGFTQAATGATGSTIITAATHGQGVKVTGSCFDATGLNVSCSATTNFGNGTVTFSIPADVPFTGTFLIK